MPAVDVCFRGATADDIDAVLALAGTTSLNNWGEADFLQVLSSDNGELRLAVSGPDVLGFVASSSVIDEVTLLNVAIHGEHRRQGLARRLIADMLNGRQAAGARRCLLEVRESNRGARALYTAMGFVVDGRRPDYYRVGDAREDAVLMSRVLEAES
jgi:ribosomal-protein-alanine N-acetyltransferase